jgi:hypothetical protein
MKAWPILIAIIVILAVICSPVVAISRSDLISQYKGQSVPARPTPAPPPFTPSKSGILPPVGSLSVSSYPPGAQVFLDGRYQGVTPVVIRDIPLVSSSTSGCQWVIITLTRTGYKNATASEIVCQRMHRTIAITLTPNQTTPSEYGEQNNYAPWSRSKNYIAF